MTSSMIYRLVLGSLLVATSMAGAQDNGDPKRWTVDDVMALKGVGDVAVSPD